MVEHLQFKSNGTVLAFYFEELDGYKLKSEERNNIIKLIRYFQKIIPESYNKVSWLFYWPYNSIFEKIIKEDIKPKANDNVISVTNSRDEFVFILAHLRWNKNQVWLMTHNPKIVWRSLYTLFSQLKWIYPAIKLFKSKEFVAPDFNEDKLTKFLNEIIQNSSKGTDIRRVNRNPNLSDTVSESTKCQTDETKSTEESIQDNLTSNNRGANSVKNSSVKAQPSESKSIFGDDLYETLSKCLNQ